MEVLLYLSKTTQEEEERKEKKRTIAFVDSIGGIGTS